MLTGLALFAVSPGDRAPPLTVVRGKTHVSFLGEGCLLRPAGSLMFYIPEESSGADACAATPGKGAIFYLRDLNPMGGVLRKNAPFPTKGIKYRVNFFGASFSGIQLTGTGELFIVDTRLPLVDAELSFSPPKGGPVDALGGSFRFRIEPKVLAMLKSGELD